MSLLLVLTLVYVAILALALAGGLIAIVYFLNQARANLQQIAAGLERVEHNTAPLEQVMTAANDGLSSVLIDLERAGENLSTTKPGQEQSQPALVEV